MESRDSNQNDTPALTAHQRGLAYRFAAFGGRCEYYCVYAPSARKHLRPRYRIFSHSKVHHFSAEALGEPQFLLIKIDAQHSATKCPQELDCNKANEPKTRHHHRLAKRRNSQADTLKCDGRNHCKCCLLI